MTEPEQIAVIVHGHTIYLTLDDARRYCPSEVAALEQARREATHSWLLGAVDIQQLQAAERRRQDLQRALETALQGREDEE